MMKPNKETQKFKGAKNAQINDRLVNDLLFAAAFFISFALPNLVFSGRHFFDTLHIMKWAATMVPIALISIAAGVKLMISRAARERFTIDLFGIGWFILIAFVTIQPFITDISSRSTFVKEWFYFASLFAVYVLSYNCFKSERLRKAILCGGAVNSAVNVVFAELLIRGLNQGFPFILDVPGNYIGNTAQQEMFGLWTAMNVFNCIFLMIENADEGDPAGGSSLKRPSFIALAILLAVNSWGLWSSTARGAILSLAVALAVVLICLLRTSRTRALRRALIAIAGVAGVVVVVLVISSALGTGRGSSLVSKMNDMLTNPTSVGGRISIWRTSLEVFNKRPIIGVGLGQYKWHFLDAQRIMYEKYPELYDRAGYNWQFTYWAHSEYIQWFAEVGIIGGAILLLLGCWWLWCFIKAMIKKSDLPWGAIWGIGMTFLLWFDACFSRPFHRIENSVWMALAFALADRSMLPALSEKASAVVSSVSRAFGILLAGASLYGLWFLAGGIMGDQLIYKALSTPGNFNERYLDLTEAEKYLMSEDDALEQQAKLLINVGKLQKQNGMDEQGDAHIRLGITRMREAFDRCPTSQMLFELLGVAQEVNDQELLRDLVRYLSPSMYRVEDPAK